jgi:hypothetical protein
MTALILTTPSKITTAGRFASQVSVPAIDANVLLINSLVAWWRPDTDFGVINGTTTWLDRFAQKQLFPDYFGNLSAEGPTVTPSFVNGQPAMLMGGFPARMTDITGQNLIPIGADFSIVVMCLPNPSFPSNFTLWGNMGSASTFDDLQIGTDGKLRPYRAGAGLGVSPTAHAANKWIWAVDSFYQSSTSRKIVANGTQELAVTASNPVANQSLVISSSQPPPGANPGTPPCYVTDVMVFSGALGETAHAADLATLSAYFQGRYGAGVFG